MYRFAPEASIEDFEDFLRVTDRSPEALSLVFLSTRDPGVALELEGLAAESPVAAQALYLKAGSALDRMTWADALIKADPLNSLGYLYRSRALFEMGESGAAIQMLADASKLPLEDRLPSIYALTPESFAAIPEDRRLEIALSDAGTWLQQTHEPTIAALSEIILTSSEDDLLDRASLVSGIFDTMQKSVDARFSDTMNHLLVSAKYAATRRTQAKLRATLSSFWGSEDELNHHRMNMSSAQTGLDQRTLSEMAPEEIDAVVLSWFTNSTESGK